MSHAYQQKQAKKNRSRYLDKLVQSKCGADLIAMNMFPNAKEVTESFAMFEATKHLDDPFLWNKEDVVAVVVGDGHSPRTAATFAMRSKWTCHSVDPALSPKYWDVRRLMVHRKKIEDVKLEFHCPTVIVMPHSHADVVDALRQIKAPTRALITMDCCVRQVINRPPDFEYVDEDVWSPLNLVRIWRDV